MITVDTEYIRPRIFSWAIDPIDKGKSKYLNVHHNIDACRGQFVNFDVRWVHWTTYVRFYHRNDYLFQGVRIASIVHEILVFF